MNHIWIPRRFKRQGEKEDIILSQDELSALPESLLILGDAGMGKTTLLKWLEQQWGCTRLSARALLFKPSTFRLPDQTDVLLIDALDEVSESRVGSVLDSVLLKLGELGYPRFVLSCRVADWRGATGKVAIAEQ